MKTNIIINLNIFLKKANSMRFKGTAISIALLSLLTSIFFNGNINFFLAIFINYIVFEIMLFIFCSGFYYFSLHAFLVIQKNITKDNIDYNVNCYGDGDERWFHKGKLHRENGLPAIVSPNSSIIKYFLEGKEVTKQETYVFQLKKKIDSF